MLPLKAESNSAKIVIANDNADECKLFRDALQTLNIPCTISVVKNGTLLVGLLLNRDFMPDFIFWDMDVPCGCAFNVNSLQLLKKALKVRSIPFIIFSKSASPGNKDYCYKLPSNEYFLRALTFLL